MTIVSYSVVQFKWESLYNAYRCFSLACSLEVLFQIVGLYRMSIFFVTLTSGPQIFLQTIVSLYYKIQGKCFKNPKVPLVTGTNCNNNYYKECKWFLFYSWKHFRLVSLNCKLVTDGFQSHCIKHRFSFLCRWSSNVGRMKTAPKRSDCLRSVRHILSYFVSLVETIPMPTWRKKKTVLNCVFLLFLDLCWKLRQWRFQVN